MATKNTTYQGTYRFRLVRSGVEFEVEGDRQFVLDQISKFASTATTSSEAVKKHGQPLPSTSPESRKPTDKALSIREFIRTFEFKKHTDFVLAFGYYLEKHAGQESFTPADVNALYYEAKLESSNTSQMLINLIKRGHIMEAKNSEGSRKRFLLTKSGEEYIEHTRVTGAE